MKFHHLIRWLDTIKTQNKWGQAYQNISYSFDVVGNVLGYENDCLGNASGNYRTKQTYSYDNLYQLIKADGETTYNPYQSSVPEFVSTYSQSFSFDADGLGNMASKVSTETVTPQKSIGDNLNYSFAYNYDKNYAHRLINAGGRYYKYDANGNIVCEQDGSFESNGEEVSYHKITQVSENVYSTDYGWGLFKEDDKGRSGKAGSNKYKRVYKWNERNQLVSSVDDNYSTAYIYGQDGQRANKYTQSSETLYFSKMWTLHTDSGNNIYGGQTAKNIYLGDTRIVTKLNSGHEPTYQEEYYKQYYYHSDHLGSATLISDYKGDEYQRIEYTPYGETWVEKTSNTGLEYLPYKFTGKEIDEETGLYYYGARYLDPRYSRWISTDPALSEYMSGSKAGMGGAYNSVNLNLYHYAGNNPVRYIDPTGLYDEENGYTKQEINDFKKMNTSEQLAFLKNEVSSVAEGTSSAGAKAGFMRTQLKGAMKLRGLFYSQNGDEKFMNEDLRNFLNTKEDGSEYTLGDMNFANGWIENPGNVEHQNFQNGGPNSKYVNIKDGREAVFDAMGNFIKNDNSPKAIDAGTYNYGMPFNPTLGSNHGQFDMKPFFRQHGGHVPSYWFNRQVGSNYGFNSQ